MLLNDYEKIKEMIRELGSILNLQTNPGVYDALHEAREGLKEVLESVDKINDEEEDEDDE